MAASSVLCALFKEPTPEITNILQRYAQDIEGAILAMDHTFTQRTLDKRAHGTGS
jgi:hypothetical protein